MAGIRANIAWYACNEEICGSPARSAVFSGVLQHTRRPWMATERAADRSASGCRMPCGVRVRTCGVCTQFSPRSEHLDVPCLPGSFGGLLSLPQMASLPKSGQGLRLYERYSSECKCMFATYTVHVSRAGPFEHHVERACVSICGLSLAVSMSGSLAALQGCMGCVYMRWGQ
eukprot:3371392-Prymnesium_polylepis.1